ncbi:MAG: sugar ABC transporter ATP-binding protein [Verrucomicrobia bacterium]|nr:sugar ABC transporter ATP-binding protein [Verrucomicrobiota bacterium]
MISEDERREVASVNQIPARLSFTALSKTFGATRALNKVSLEVLAGEIHGLVGENGSGKSTLIKVLAGFYEPDAGSKLSIDGAPVRLPWRPGDSSRYGISFVHQDLALIPSLTVLENLRVSDLCLSPRWFISWKAEIRAAKELLEEFDLDLDPLMKIEAVDIGSRALLAILRAMDGMRKSQAGLRAIPAAFNAANASDFAGSYPKNLGAAEAVEQRRGLLVLDEPTPFLARTDVERLFTLARRIKAQGSSVLFVSHDLDEVLALTDRVTVIRDGTVVGTFLSKEVSKADLIEQIIGHPLSMESGNASGPRKLPNAAPAIAVTGLTGEYVHGISFEIREGEIVGMSGLLGSGFTEVPSLLFGAIQAAGGILKIGKISCSLTDLNPAGAVEKGIALIPVDRRGEGVVEELTIVENISLPVLKRFGPWRLQHAKLKRATKDLVRDFDVRPADPENRVGNLSGGNQQKILLAKWLQTNPRIILLDEPTQGVDVGARQQIYRILKEQAASGTMILCASSDYEELATLCSRVLIFSHGKIVEELAGTQLTKDAIAQRCHVG